MQTTSGPAVRRSVSSESEVDWALASHLIADGRVAPPESAEWKAELIALMATARGRLASSSSVFLMGENYVPLFLVMRDDLAAVAPDQLPDDDEVLSPKHRKPRGERPLVSPIAYRTDAWPVAPVAEVPVEQFSAEFQVYRAGDDGAADYVPTIARAPIGDLTESAEHAEFADILEVAGSTDDAAGAKYWSRRELSGRTRWALAIGGAACGVLLVGGLGAYALDARSGSDAAGPTSVVPGALPTTAAPIPDSAELARVAKPVQAYVPPAPTAAQQAPRRGNRQNQQPRQRGFALPPLPQIPGLPPLRLPG